MTIISTATLLPLRRALTRGAAASRCIRRVA